MSAAAAAGAAMTDLIRSKTTEGGLGVLMLQRERALNAFNIEMATASDEALQEWLGNDRKCHAVLLHSSSDRAFCSGGDIKALRQAALDNPFTRGAPPETHLVARIFQAEYRLVADLATMHLPAAALCHGVWMGFGVGLGGFLPIRIVTETTVFAMPECSIGLLPDVAFAAMAAQRMPLHVALYLALTGARVSNPSDLLAIGMATHFVPSAALPDLKAALFSEAFESASADAQLRAAVQRFAEPAAAAPAGSLQAKLPLIQVVLAPAIATMAASRDAKAALGALFSTAQDLADSETANAAARAFAAETLQQLKAGAPRSLVLTLLHFFSVYEDAARDGRQATAVGCLETEFYATVRLTGQHDFIEGVRAAVVDKDRNPAWDPATVDSVDAVATQALLDPIPGGPALR